MPPIDVDEWHAKDREYRRECPGGIGSLSRDVNLEDWKCKLEKDDTPIT